MRKVADAHGAYFHSDLEAPQNLRSRGKLRHEDANPNKGICVKSVLVQYCNKKGRCVHQLLLEDDGHLENDASDLTGNAQGAYAAQALISQVTTQKVGLPLAHKVRSVSIGDRKPVEIADVMPELETSFGATSVQWARAIFTHLNLKPPSLQ